MPDTAIADPERWSGEFDHVTLELMALVQTDDRVETALRQSIQSARDANPDEATNPVGDLRAYYRFVDRMSRLIPRDVLENPEHLVHDEILESICYFYFLIDQSVPALEAVADEDAFDMYRPALQYYPPFSAWVREFADAWGSFLDTEASWNRRIYREFYRDERFGLQEGWYETPAAWESFNDFFSRHLRDPDQRPIHSGGATVTSPADAVPQGVWEIDDDSRITVADGDGIDVKNRTYYRIPDLLGEDSDYADAFAGGTFTHTFLNVNDYHRYHFPVGGTVRARERIEQNVALEVSYDEDAGEYSPVDSTGWQFTQTRGHVVVDTGSFGLVGLVPMGMAEVSAVRFEENVRPGETFRKGDPLGYFLFGGSDFVMLFQETANFRLVAPEDGDGGYEHRLMGEPYGFVDADE